MSIFELEIGEKISDFLKKPSRFMLKIRKEIAENLKIPLVKVKITSIRIGTIDVNVVIKEWNNKNSIDRKLLSTRQKNEDHLE